MPYPALPPELPPLVSAQPAELTHCPNSSHSGATQSQRDSEKPAAIANLAKPESFASDSQPYPGATQTTDSCAALLGQPAAVGYLPTASDLPLISPLQATRPITVASKTLAGMKPVARPETLAQPDRFALEPKAPPPRLTPPLRSPSAKAYSPTYTLSGATGKLAKMSDKLLMQQLDQAVMGEVLAESYAALSTLTAADLQRFAERANAVSQAPRSPAESIPAPSETLFPDGQIPLTSPVTPPVAAPTPPSPTPSPPPTALPSPPNVIEVTADQQTYDQRQQIFTAEGNVKMRFRNTLLEADRIQVNLTNRLTVAEGQVALTRGNQVLRGQRFEYNFVQGVGSIEKARGDIYLPTAGIDTTLNAETALGDRATLSPPVSDRITARQPVGNVRSPGGINFSVGAGRDINRLPGALPSGGELNRLRFEAERLDFTPEGWVAQNIDITNDPFSPPEFVFRADKAVLTRVSPLTDEVVATRPRLVFDQKVSVPFLRRRFVLSRAEQEPALFRFGFDNQDRGGLFLEGILNVINTGKVNFSIFPQIFLQRMFLGETSEGIGDLNNYGVRAALDVNITDRTILRGRAALTSLDFDEFENRFRASVRLEQQVLPMPLGFHRVALEYSYRDRLFNGSLGFQTVQTSLGAVFQSPNIVLGNTGIVINYQTGYQLITADTDREDLLEPVRTNSLVRLGRFQATAGIGRTFYLWLGKQLPATRDEGLNYTANPVIPQITLSTTLRGVFSQYTSGDSQRDLIATVGLFGQFGHFSRKFFDYTAFGVSYSQVIGSGASPFLFDRTVDNRVLSLSFFQQVYGPVRVGVQSSINVDTRDAFSTDVFLEYSRRTHGIIVRYNPVLEIGSISFRVSDFNWTGTAEPFPGAGVVPVEAGVVRQ
jgi:hypothetical protein